LRRAVDLFRHQQGPALVGDAVDPAVLVVAVRIAQVMLEMADEHLRPVHQIERAIRGDGDAGRAEIRGFGEVGGDQVFEGFALDAGAFLGEPGAEDPLYADHVGIEELTLPIVGEMAAAEDAGARAGPRGAVPKLLHAGVFAGVEVAAHGGAIVVGVAGGVGDQVVAPVVEHPAVRIGEAIGRVAHEFSGFRFVAVDRAVDVADRAVEGFHAAAVEDSVTQIDRAAGLQTKRVGGVVGIRRIDAMQYALAEIRLAVAIRVAEEPEVGCLHHQHAIAIELEPGRAIEAIGEGGDFRGFAGRGVEVDDQ
jgi:hypothetical protein